MSRRRCFGAGWRRQPQKQLSSPSCRSGFSRAARMTTARSRASLCSVGQRSPSSCCWRTARCVCVSVSVCDSLCVCLFLYVCVSVSGCVCLGVCLSVCVCVGVSVSVSTPVCPCVCVCASCGWCGSWVWFVLDGAAQETGATALLSCLLQCYRWVVCVCVCTCVRGGIIIFVAWRSCFFGGVVIYILRM